MKQSKFNQCAKLPATPQLEYVLRLVETLETGHIQGWSEFGSVLSLAFARQIALRVANMADEGEEIPSLVRPLKHTLVLCEQP